MQEAVVLEAASAEQRVEGVHRLVSGHGLGERPVDVGRALRRQRVGVAAGRQLYVPGMCYIIYIYQLVLYQLYNLTFYITV